MTATKPQAGAPVGVIAALPPEARVFGLQIPRNSIVNVSDQTLLYLCGVGPDNAARAANALLARDVSGLVSWGTAGGLSPHMTTGTCLLPTTVLCADVAYETSQSWQSALFEGLRPVLPVSGSALYASDTVVATVDQKKRLYDDTGAVAVDMESGAIAAHAVDAQVPFVCIRVLLDTAQMSLPPQIYSSLDVDGFPDLKQLAILVAKQPSAVFEVAKIARCFTTARRNLVTVLQQLGPRLHAP